MTYALSNSQKADLVRIATNFDINTYKGEFWGSRGYETTSRIGGFAITPEDGVLPVTTANIGLLNGCEYFNLNTDPSVFTPVMDSSLYEATIGLDRCATAGHGYPINGFYTGLATSLSRNGTDDVLLVAFTDGRFGFFAEYTIYLR